MPSFEPFDGAGIVTLEPAWKPPPSTEYSVTDTPEPESLAERLTVTSEAE